MGDWVLKIPDHVLAQRDAIGPADYDWSAVMESIEWYLTHKPLKIGKRTQDDAVRFRAWARPKGLPPIRVWFVIDVATSTVTVLRIAL